MQNTATPNNHIPQRSVQLRSTIVGALSMMHRVPFMHTCPTSIIHWSCCNMQFLSLQFSTFTGEVHQLLVVDSLVRELLRWKKHVQFFEQIPQQFVLFFQTREQLFDIKTILYGASWALPEFCPFMSRVIISKKVVYFSAINKINNNNLINKTLNVYHMIFENLNTS